MIKTSLILLFASACTTTPGSGASPDAPTLGLANVEHGLTLRRAWDHDFTGATATVNGVDAGPPAISPGRAGTIGNPPTTSMVSFAARMLPGVTAIHAEIDDGGELFTVDAPDVGIPRTFEVRTPLDQPLTGNEAITIVTNVGADTIDRSSVLHVEIDGHVCSWASDVTPQADGWSFALKPGFTDWYDCGPRPAAGTRVAASLAFTVNIDAHATCSTTCFVSPVGGSLERTIPVTLQF